jgi:hypothetical protein
VWWKDRELRVLPYVIFQLLWCSERQKPHPFDFAQGRLCRKKTRQGWGTLGIAELRSLSFASQSALEGLVQGGFVFFVLLLTDAALFVFDFELEEFFFQAFEQL